MSKTIPGVPETISREDYIRLIESVGFDPNELIDLKFESGGIRAKVAARDENGHSFVSDVATEGTGEFSVSAHDVYIPIIDGPVPA